MLAYKLVVRRQGGMKATIWNDFCQMLIVVVGLLCVIVLGAIKVGGMDDAWKVNEAGGRIVFDESVFEITCQQKL